MTWDNAILVAAILIIALVAVTIWYFSGGPAGE